MNFTNNLRITVLVLLGLVLMASCQPILRIIAGVNNPRFQNIQSIKEFSEKIGMPINQVLVRDEDTIYNQIDRTHLAMHLADRALCFNKEGFLLIEDTLKSGSACVIPGSDYFDIVSELYRIDSSSHISEYTKSLVGLDNQYKPVFDQSDITLIYYWAIWYKGFTKRRIKEINEALLAKNDSLKVTVFYANTDLLKHHYVDSIVNEKLKVKFNAN